MLRLSKGATQATNCPTTVLLELRTTEKGATPVANCLITALLKLRNPKRDSCASHETWLAVTRKPSNAVAGHPRATKVLRLGFGELRIILSGVSVDYASRLPVTEVSQSSA